MRKVVMVLFCIVLSLLSYFMVTFPAKSQNFDSQAISQVSKGLSDSNLLNQDHNSTPKVVVGKEADPQQMGISAQGKGGKAGLTVAAAMDMGAIPLELRDMATQVKGKYGDNIFIVIDRSLNRPGAFKQRHDYKEGGRTVFGPAVIRINPDKFKSYGITYGEALSHEMGHALDHRIEVLTEKRPTKAEAEHYAIKKENLYVDKVNNKINENPLRSITMQQSNFNSNNPCRLDTRFRDPVYLATQNMHLSRLPDVKILGLPTSYFSKLPSTSMPTGAQVLPKIK